MTSEPFKNEPFTDFSQADHAQAVKEGIEEARESFGQTIPLWINGEAVTTDATFTSTNPSNTSEVLATCSMASQAHVDQAIDAASQAFEEWKTVSPINRAGYLLDAAMLLRERKHQFSAWMMFEEGKSWVEADADTAEAIDFLEFYAREMIRLSDEQPLTRIPSEDNHLTYIPLGVGAVIPPWNFPLAIALGMTSAAIVSGNTVLLKPASDSPGIAWQFVQLFHEVGIPKGVLNFVPGNGSEIGDHMVTHPKIRFISFTGSMKVGLRINELAAKPQKGQMWIKRVIAEMGGKDAIVVDESADVDTVAEGIVAAAFGFQGQKCSACSRAIIHEGIYDAVCAKVVELASKIEPGNPWEEGVNFGPMINAAAKAKTLEYIEIGKKEGKLVLGGEPGDPKGHYVQPTIFKDIPNEARLSKEEIFGPVLALTKAKDFKEAIAFANDTAYGLTGAVYSDRKDHLEYARAHYHVGNLYFNRKCTGALVGVHPFGGFNMSGTDSKAGGRDYLLLFTQAKLISEKV